MHTILVKESNFWRIEDVSKFQIPHKLTLFSTLILAEFNPVCYAKTICHWCFVLKDFPGFYFQE